MTMTVFDADGHVEESVTTFSYLEKEYHDRRPLPLGFDKNTAYGIHNAVWLIDGMAFPKLVGKGGFTLKTPTSMVGAQQKPASIGSQELTDMEARLRDLDSAGIDKQVVYPTLFLIPTTDDLGFEAALMRAYNNFMADRCSKSGGRLHFAALVPIRDVGESIKEMRRARNLGAASVLLLGIAWDRSLGDQALYPFYEEAAKLQIPVCIHFGWGCPDITDLFRADEAFYSAALPVVMACHSIVGSDVLDTFPKLRFAFLETGSTWAPYVIHQLRRSPRTRCARDPAEYFREGRVYIACDTDEDINYVRGLIGDDCLVVASDYPHADASRDETLKHSVMAREDVPLRVREKILSDNPRRLYEGKIQ